MKLKYVYYFEVVYGSLLIFNLRNVFQKHGESFFPEKMLYRSFFLLMIKFRENPYLLIFEVLEKIRPFLFVKFKFKQAINKDKLVAVVVRINSLNQYKCILKWLRLLFLVIISDKKGSIKLFNEFINIYIYNTSFLLTKKHEMYQCFFLNKFNIHYRW
jgi:hypothetical protein